MEKNKRPRFFFGDDLGTKMKLMLAFCIGLSLPLLLLISFGDDNMIAAFFSVRTPMVGGPHQPGSQQDTSKTFHLTDLAIEPLVGLMRSPLFEAELDEDIVEDRSYLKLLPSLVNVEKAWKGKRKIYYDLGLNTYASSLGWLKANYSVTFDAIYGWEMNATIFRLPTAASLAAEFGGNSTAAQEYLNTIHYEFKAVDVGESPTTRDVGSFIKQTSSVEDFVMLKMDVEGVEWRLLPHFIEEGVIDHIDELFVEIHFYDPRMSKFGWDQFGPHTLEEAHSLIQQLRDLGVFAHYWP